MSHRRRVVITGLGVVAPNGIGKMHFWDSLLAGKSAIRPISLFDPSPYPCRVAGEVQNFRGEDFMMPARVKHRGRFSQLAVAAAKLALEDAVLDAKDLRKLPGDRVRVAMGTSMGGAGDIIEEARLGFTREGVKGIPLVSSLEFAAHAAVSHISVELGISGQALTLGSACTTGFDAIDWASAQISRGHADLTLAGATDAPLAEFAYASLCALRIFAEDGVSRPYDLNRTGMILGEGAAVVVLEELERAVARGAPIYAEILGAGHGNEGGYGPRTDTAEKALANAIGIALSSAGLRARDIDYISAHGNGLPDYDLVETRAFKEAFGELAYNIPVSSIKSMIGHAMGAGSVLQVAASCMTLQSGILTPTINLETPDPECDLDYVPQKARAARVRHILLNAHAMGGTHSVLVLGAATN